MKNNNNEKSERHLLQILLFALRVNKALFDTSKYLFATERLACWVKISAVDIMEYLTFVFQI